jgi:predicted acylesterase/phospholipase RssA
MATFKILSIDGGGIRGIIPAFWLTSLESELDANSGSTLHDAFDIFAGTSTGSIIAAGLAIGKSADEIRKLYETKGSSIFSCPLLRNPLRYWGALRPAYSGAGLEKVLNSEFKTRKLGDVPKPKRLLIAAFRGGSRTLKLFDSADPLDQDYLLRDIVRGSCAAPTYLPAQNIEIAALNQLLLDGGLAANNPAALALAVAFKDGHLPEDVLLVSLGTGVSQRPISDTLGTKGGKVQWVKSIVEVVFDGSSSANELLVQHVLPLGSYFRFQKRDLHADPALDRADEAHLTSLQSEAQQYLDQESTLFKRLVGALKTPDPAPRHAFDGHWDSRYTWNEEGAQFTNDFAETVLLKVTGQHVAGETTESGAPYIVKGKIQGSDILGYTISRDKPFKIWTSFVLRMNMDSQTELAGHWVGTGSEVHTGEWKLTRPRR